MFHPSCSPHLGPTDRDRFALVVVTGSVILNGPRTLLEKLGQAAPGQHRVARRIEPHRQGGDRGGLPRTDLASSVLAATTSFEQPRILYDSSPGFQQQEAKALWTAFTNDLLAADAHIEALNEKRPRPFYSFAPSNLETAVSV